MPYLGYLLAQAVKAGQTVASALTSAASYVTRVGGSVVELSASAEALKSPSAGSAVFNGSSNYVQILSDGNNSAFDTQTFTIGAWVYFETTGGSDRPVWSYDYTSHNNPYYSQQIRIDSIQNIQFFWNNSSTYQQISVGGIVTLNKWYYVTATFKSGEQKLYVNGNVVGSSSNGDTISYYSQEVWIGRSNYAYMDGNISNVAFWSRVLTSEEIRSVMMKSYADLSASETKGLVSWYALDDISGTTVPDSHGNFNGTAY